MPIKWLRGSQAWEGASQNCSAGASRHIWACGRASQSWKPAHLSTSTAPILKGISPPGSLFMQWTANGWPNHFPNQGYQGSPNQVIQGGWEIPAVVDSNVQLSWNKLVRCRNECWTYCVPKKTRQWMKMFSKKSKKRTGEVWRHQKLTEANMPLGHALSKEQLSLFCSDCWE